MAEETMNEVVNADESKFDGTVLRTMKGSVVIPSESHVTIMCTDPETDEAGSMKINLQAYDEDRKSWMPNKEVYEAAEKLVQDVFGVELIDVVKDPFAVMDKEFEAYYDGERVSLNPIKTYVRYTPIGTVEANTVKKLAMPVESMPIDEFDGRRFNIGITVDVKGKLENLRVSQLVLEPEDDESQETVVGVKYESKDVVQMRDQLQNGDLTPETAEKVKKVCDSLVKKARRNKVDEFKDVFGIDIDQMIADKGTFTFSKIEVRRIPNADNAYLVATVDPASL